MAQGWDSKEEVYTASNMNAHTRKVMRRVALVVDATGSMSFALEAIRDMLLNVVRLLRLVASGVVSHICLVVYRDYCDKPVTQSMTVHVDDDEGVHNMLQFIRATSADGGGDGPEAAKTAVWELMKALPQQGNGGDETWVLWFVDAPPHLAGQRSDNKAPEDHFLCNHAFPTDWLQICGLLKGQACMVCFPVHLSSGGSSQASFCEMARITGGHCFQTRQGASTRDMAAFSLSLLSQLCGYSVDLPSSVADVLHAAENGPLPNSEEDLTCTRCQGAIRILGDASQVPSISGTQTRRAADLVRMLHDTANPLLGRTLSEFERMLDDPASTMVLTVNELLGVLWRELCKKRFEGPQTCALKNRLSAAVSTMLAGSKRADGEVLQKFLQDSYDQTEAIHDMLGQAEERCGADAVGAGKVYLTLPHPPKMLTSSELLDLIRSCHTQEVVAAMFSGLVATTCKPSQQDQPYVPLFGLSDEETFRLLPHLLCPGIMFETRGACILAAVCLTKSAGPRELRLKAEGLLRSKRGEQWSNAEAYPENRSGAFAALMCALRGTVDSGPEPTLLPAEEYHAYALALFTARLRTARHNPLDGIKTAKHAYGAGVHGRVRPDFGLRMCASCGQARSLFALAKIGPVEGGVCCCTLCTADDGVEEARQVSAAAGRFAQCHECDEHYLLQRPEVLKSVRTKCPGCRGVLPTRSLSCACQGCGSTYQFAVAVSDTESTRELEQSLPEGISVHRFTCPTCHTKQEDPFDSHAIPLGEFLHSNGLPSGLGPSELTGSAAKAAVLLDSSGNPLSIVTQAAATAAEESGSRCPTLLCKESGSYQKALTIRNPPGELYDKVKAALEGPCFRLPCDLCAELHTSPALSSMCGHRACRSCVCEGCKGRWFGQASPGTKCPLAVLHCAFCKRPPQAGVLARHNARLAQLAKNHRASSVPLSSLDPSHAYAWCIACDKLAPLERGGGCCAAEEEGTNTHEELRDFMCTACRDAVDKSAVRGEQSCPNPACGIGIEKNGGCNHMTCTACGHHWCWLCRADFGNGADSVVAAIDHMCGVDPDVREEEAEEGNDLI